VGKTCFKTTPISLTNVRAHLQTKSVWREEWERILIPLFPRNKLTLDCGCGPAYYKNLFGDNYVGLDIQRYFSKDGMYIRASTTELPFREASFEFVLASALFEHIENPNRALSEICRVLKKEGWVVLSTPSRYGAKYETLKTYRGYDVEDLERLAHYHKLTVRSRFKIGGAFAIMFAEIENIFRQRLKTAKHGLSSFEGEPYYDLFSRSSFGRMVLRLRALFLHLTVAVDTRVPFKALHQGVCILASK
jgi:SAM-dependent methyltransferase